MEVRYWFTDRVSSLSTPFTSEDLSSEAELLCSCEHGLELALLPQVTKILSYDATSGSFSGIDDK